MIIDYWSQPDDDAWAQALLEEERLWREECAELQALADIADAERARRDETEQAERS